MRYLRIILQAIVLSLCFGTAFSQQVPMYSQYIMNGFLINPSFAGRDGYTTVNLTVREQWVGMNGAPSTYAASFRPVSSKIASYPNPQRLERRLLNLLKEVK